MAKKSIKTKFPKAKLLQLAKRSLDYFYGFDDTYLNKRGLQAMDHLEEMIDILEKMP